MDTPKAAGTALSTVIKDAMSAHPDIDSVEKLADRSGIPYSTLYRKLHHQPELIKWDDLGRILDALDMSLVDFAVKVERVTARSAA
ncbi:hypothetical protein DUY81_13830 [Acidipropionibacterium acidipropionici]|uniref:HTH cro/C1-type domain-containing protein n=1 Tax=Acidipropionibacterium acidipropionici TaxID=1748 RepID=A0AAC9AP40_9ACTN|nr:helix-turn-helix transcriptional regulator [Acidipropionibacterium acidipropionici]AMS06490.1 hypothetical protein AXH35_14535 [Acidipropionibacterium acidipropionici]AOZ47938.1 hypothetical protein A8L58_15990 [Acidipropionibacterium acidipropionici]AZP38717.1 hypothetical protein DUY81_13830 [Acidipropionibacterium acidipropionici]